MPKAAERYMCDGNRVNKVSIQLGFIVHGVESEGWLHEWALKVKIVKQNMEVAMTFSPGLITNSE